MTIVETSNVGVEVGMVDRGVMDAVGVANGMDVRVTVGREDDVVATICVVVTGAFVVNGAQALILEFRVQSTLTKMELADKVFV